MLALLSLLAFASGDVTKTVPLYLGSDVSAETLALALEEVETIFAPGDVRFRFDVSPKQPISGPVLTVVLLPRPSRHVVSGCSRDLHDHRLGHTHLRARRITLWSEQIARAVDGNWDREDVPTVDDELYARALGRVLAHELGHLLLSLNGHHRRGLMRPSFSHRSLTSRSRRAFRLSDDDLATIRRVLTRFDANER